MKKEHLLQFIALLFGVALVVMAGCTPKAIHLKDGAVSPLESTMESPACWKNSATGGTSPEREGALDGTRAPIYLSAKEFNNRLEARSFPRYPVEAVKANQEDTVVAKISFFWDGRFKRLKFLSGHPVFFESITDTVESWRLRPFLVDGCPVETYTTQKFGFSFGKNRSSHAKSPEVMSGPQWEPESKVVPNFTIRDTRGETFRMSDHTQTAEGGPSQPKKVLMVFFSIFCEPCKQELPILHRYHALWKDEVQILLISIDGASELAKLNELLPPASTPYPVVIDEDLSIAKVYLGDSGSWQMPSMLLIGKDGQPVLSIIGRYNDESLLRVLRKNQ